MKHLRKFNESKYSKSKHDDIIDPQDIEEIIDILMEIEDDTSILVEDLGESSLDYGKFSTHVFSLRYKEEHVLRKVNSYYLKEDIKQYILSYIKRCVSGKNVVGLINRHFQVHNYGDHDVYFDTLIFCSDKVISYIDWENHPNISDVNNL